MDEILKKLSVARNLVYMTPTPRTRKALWELDEVIALLKERFTYASIQESTRET